MTPVDKLAMGIEQALADGGAAMGGERLAAEYAQWCAATNQRLEQCERLLAGKAEYEALQAAETAPSLLDVCAALSFEKAVTWRATCQSKGWARAEELNERAISALNDLYAKGINTNHPLYRDYRRAIAEHDDVKALAVLKTILRLNPNDANAQQEIQRLQGKARTTAVARLEGAVQQGNATATLQALEEIEAEGWTGAVKRQALEQAQGLRRQDEAAKALERCNGLVEWLDRLKDRGEWQEALPLVQEVERLCASNGLTLEPDAAGLFGIVRDWARDCKQKDDDEKAFQAALRDMEFQVEQGETNVLPATAHALRAEQHALLNAWRDVESFGRPVSETLQTRMQRRNSVLQAEINRLGRQRRLLTTVGVLAAVVLTGVAAVVTFRWHWTKGQVADLIALRNERKVGVAEKLVNTLSAQTGKALPAARLSLALEEAKQWLTAERQRLTDAQAQLAKLRGYQQSEFKELTAEEYLKELARGRDLVAELATEYAKLGAADFLEYENALDSVIQGRRQQLQREFLALLKTAEEHAAVFDEPEPSLPALRRAVLGLIESLGQLTAAAQPSQERLRLPDSLTSRIAPIQAKLAPYREALSKLDAADLAIRRAKTLDEYYAALEKYDAEHLRQQPAVRAARRVTGNRLSLLEVERQQLAPRDTEVWQSLLRTNAVSNLPVEVMPAELSKWLSLRDDENLQNIYHYLIPPTEGDLVYCYPLLKDRRFYTRGPWQKAVVDSLGLRFKAVAFVPAATASKAEFAEFNFRCEPNPTKPLEDTDLLRLGQLCPESTVIKRIGLDTWINDAGDRFRRSPLAVLDDLRAADSMSPLFKAYLHWRLLEIISLRPMAWGEQNAPGIARDRAALKELGAGELRSGDWMVPMRQQQFDAKLTAFYRENGTNSYSKQAQFIERLLGEAHVSGFRFIGYIALDGAPLFTSEGNQAKNVWGLSEQGLQLVRLWRGKAASSDSQPAVKPQPFSPLFACVREPGELMRLAAEKARVDWKTLGIEQLLPPLFREESRP